MYMKTTGFLILNTMSNICTFITLALVLSILYYIKEKYDIFLKRIKVLETTKKIIKHSIPEEETKKCLKGLNIFPSYLKKIKNFNKSKISPEIQEEKLFSNEESKDCNKPSNYSNSFTPPLQKTITFVPEKKKISNNYRQYLNTCS